MSLDYEIDVKIEELMEKIQTLNSVKDKHETIVEQAAEIAAEALTDFIGSELVTVQRILDDNDIDLQADSDIDEMYTEAMQAMEMYI